MPTEVQNGLCQIHGIRNDGSAITIEGYASFLLDTAKATHKFKLTEGEDENGFDANLTATNPFVETEIAFRPAGADRDAAEAVGAFLEPLAKVAMAHFAIAELNGDWIYTGDGSIDLSHATGTMSLKVRKYKDAAQNASLVQTVSV
jgi:hypothetical protein